MRSTRIPGLALLSLAVACSAASPGKSSQPAPAKAPAQKEAQSTAAIQGIPPGHLPPLGQCRVWVPGEPPGQQAKPRSCTDIERSAPPGTWIVSRPADDPKVVQIREVDRRRRGVVVHLRVYDLATGTLVRES